MAEWTAAYINDLPDSSFLYVEPGGEKDDQGRTVPRAKRHFPVKGPDGSVDLPHLRNALARIPQSSLPDDVKARCTAAARRLLDAATKDDDVSDITGWKSAPAYRFELDGAKEGDVLVAFAKTGVVDRDRHLTEPGAFPAGREVPISSYAHASWPEKGGRLPTGRAAIGEEGDLALARGRFFVETTHGRDTYLTVKALEGLQEWSYGYRILEKEKAKDDSGPILRLKKLDVREVSPTLVGAGIGTHTVAIKSGDDEGPLAGLPYAEELERVSFEIERIVSRSKALRDLRAKEGRELSDANRARLLRLRESIAALAETQAELEELLSRTGREELEPDAKALGAQLLAQFARTTAELDGLTVSIGG